MARLREAAAVLRATAFSALRIASMLAALVALLMAWLELDRWRYLRHLPPNDSWDPRWDLHDGLTLLSIAVVCAGAALIPGSKRRVARVALLIASIPAVVILGLTWWVVSQ